MAKLKYLVIHCLDTPPSMIITKETIIRWHIKERGWKKPGYTDIIDADGTLVNIHPFNLDKEIDSWEITNGARGFNEVSKHIALVGGWHKDKTGKWIRSGKHNPEKLYCEKALLELRKYIELHLDLISDNLIVLGHCDLPGVHKSCPNFDVRAWMKTWK